MAQPYVGEIRMFAGNFAPAGWKFCEGQLLPISENETLFQLIGTTYGGDGQSTFGSAGPPRPDPDSSGQRFHPGRDRWAEEITLTVEQIPTHSHPFLASTALATNETPAANVLGQTEIAYYGDESPFVAMAACIASIGGASPTRTFSRTSASTSSSRCSASSRPRRKATGAADVDHRHVNEGERDRDGRSVCRRDSHFPVQLSRPRAGRGATGSSCRSRRTPALFSLLGTTYGGDGKSTFALPDLQGSAAMQPGQGPGTAAARSWAKPAARETVTLLESRDPVHTHALSALETCRRPDRTESERAVDLAQSKNGQRLQRHDHATLTPMRAPGAPAGRWEPAAQQHAAVSDVMNFCIALQGVFPPRPVRVRQGS